MKHLITIFLLSVTLLNAQITITRSDVASRLNGSVMRTTEYIAKSAVAFPVGSAIGTLQYFNFSSIPPQYTSDSSSQKFYSASGVSFRDSFPGITHATIDTSYDFTTGAMAVNAVAYKLNETGLYSLGYFVRYVAGTSQDSTLVYKTLPGKLILPLPLSLNTIKTSVDTMVIGNTKSISYTTLKADGYGSITLPNGRTKDVLRILSRTRIDGYVGNLLISSSNEASLSYFTKDLDQIEVSLEDTTLVSGIVPVTDITFSTWDGVTSVKDPVKVAPKQFSLEQNYPNPFNPSTEIKFSLQESQKVTLEVFNAIGEKVATVLNNSELSSGMHSVHFNAAQLNSGLYYYRLSTANGALTKKMTLLK